MMDPSLFLLLPVLLPGPPLPVLGQQITKPPPPLPSSTLEELPDVVPIPQSCLVVLAVLPDSSQMKPLRFPRQVVAPDLRIHTNHRNLSDPVTSLRTTALCYLLTTL